ncbi:hypothetical protein SNE40_017140 [Patella caerulea]|uniref:Fibrinogen C-terminal domain-containing protein n=1 Tax=Patella caerulea TaxID=87958 RepID=A0AAN8JD53_PATCE
MYDEETKLCSLYESGENCLVADAMDNKVCYKQNYVCGESNCTRCPIGYYGDQCQHIIRDCHDGFTKALFPPKIMLSFIQPAVNSPITEVICGFRQFGWTRILSRHINCLEVDFNRTYGAFSDGFGNPPGNHFIGLENIYRIIENHDSLILRVEFTFVDRTFKFGDYNNFAISSKIDNFRLMIGSYRDGPTFSGDSLVNGIHNLNGRPFSTFDRDFTNHSCPDRFGGGWWYLDDPVCSRSNINGKRHGEDFESTWHWLDDFGNKTSFSAINLIIFPDY